MSWDNKTVLKFIELYQMHPCIWDPENGQHKNRQILSDSWNKIKQGMLPWIISVTDLKKKKESLMAAYRGYKKKIKQSERSGSGASDVYQCSWFAFSLMDSFLGSIYICKSTINTEHEETEDIYNNATTDTAEVLLPGEEYFTQLSTSSLPLQHHSSGTQQTSKQQSLKRKQHNPPELIHAKNQIDEAFQLMKNVYQHPKEDDECTVFGILIAKKLRKLSEERRDIVMVQINQIFVDERTNNRLHSNLMYSPSPTQLYEAPSPMSSSDANYNMTAPGETNPNVTTKEYIPPDTGDTGSTIPSNHNERVELTYSS